MTDLPNLQDIKDELNDVANHESHEWVEINVGSLRGLVAALEAVREESFDTLVKYEGHPEPYRFGLADQASATLDLINQHLTIGETK